MTKLLIGLFAITTIALFQGCDGKSSHSARDSSKTSNASLTAKATTACIGCTTLNGIDASIAIQRIRYFNSLKDADKHQDKEASIEFSSKQIDSIYRLLLVESADSVPVERRATGVRFYLACDTVKPGSKLNISICMVSTRARLKSDPAGDGDPANIDYYNHNGYFKQGRFGDTTNTINTKKPKHDSGDLYLQDDGDDDCSDAPADYVDNSTARSWVYNFRYMSSAPINTRSEWFSVCFIKYFFSTILSNPNELGGLRVYLALGTNKYYLGQQRDLFLLVPSDNYGGDYYDCLSLADLPCPPSTRPTVSNQPQFLSPGNKNGKHIKINKEKLERWARYRFLFSGGGSGGYDNGELCPTYCN